MPSQKPTTQQTEPEALKANQIAYLIENPATLEHWICSGNLEEANYQVELQSNLLLLKLHKTHVNDVFQLVFLTFLDISTKTRESAPVPSSQNDMELSPSSG